MPPTSTTLPGLVEPGALPLIGRDDELAVVLRALGEGAPGALFFGPRGIGRSRLVVEAGARATAAGYEVERWDPTTTAASGTVVLVDDAERLRSDADVLRGAVTTSGVRVVGAVGPGLAPPPIERLWRDDGVVRVDLPALAPNDVAALAAHVAGGPFDGIGTDRLMRWTGGVPATLELLLCWEPIFERRHGSFSIGHRLPMNEHLRAEIDRLERSVSPDVLAVAQLVAVAEAVPLLTLQQLFPAATIDAARVAQLIADTDADLNTGGAPETLVTAASGPVAILLLAGVDAATERGFTTRLASAAHTRLERGDELTDAEMVALATELAVEGPTNPRAREIVGAGIATALRRRRSGVAVDLARAAWQSTSSIEFGHALANALEVDGQVADALAVAAEVADAADGDDDRGRSAHRQASLLASCNRRDEATRVLRAALAETSDPLWHAQLDGSLASHELFAGHIGDAYERARPLSGLAPEATLIAAVAATVLGHTSDADDVLATPPLHETPAEQDGSLTIPLLSVARAVAATEAGDLDRAHARALTGYSNASRAGHRPLLGWTALCLGRVDLLAGRARSALRWFRESLAGFGALNEPGYLSWGYAGCAGAFALLGDTDGAESAAAAEHALPAHDIDLYRPESRRLLAYRMAASGNVEAASSELSGAAAAARETKQRFAEAACLHELAMFSAPEAAVVERRLRRLRDDTDGAIVPVRYAHVVALCSGDAHALADVGRAWADLGMHLYASAAWAAAADRSTGRDETRRARRALSHRRRCEGATFPGQGVLTPVLLSVREREVGELAASALARSSIASRLSISPRTVDRHLSSVFEKLGITRRAQLRDAMADLGDPEPPLSPAAGQPGDATWPVVGRRTERDRIRAASSDPELRGVVLTGPAGIGKTRLALDMRDEMTTHGWTPCTVTPSSMQSSTLDLPTAGPGRKVVLVVDDLASLDADALTRIAPLMSSRHCFTIGTARRPGAGLPAALDTRLATVALSALGSADVATVLEHRLQAPVLHSAVSQLHNLAGGNPLLLKELTLAALADGTLRQSDGAWALTGRPTTTPRLADVIRPVLAPLRGDARDVAELLAAAGPIPRTVLEAIAGPAVVARLVHSRIADDDGDNVALAHPSFADVLLDDLAPADRRRRVRALVDRTPVGLRPDPLRWGLWLLDADASGPAFELVEAARHALDVGSIAAAHRLGDRARHEGGDDAELTWAEVLIAEGQFAVADVVLRDLSVRGRPQTRVAAALRRSDSALWNLGDPDLALGALGVVDDVRDHAAVAHTDRTSTAEQAQLIGSVAHQDLMRSSTHGPRQHVFKAGAALTLGALDDAVHFARGGLDLLREGHTGCSEVADALRSVEVEALLESGRVHEAANVVENWQPPGALPRGGLSRRASEAARVELQRGDVRAARLWCLDGLGDPAAPEGSQRWLWLMSGLAMAAALAGDGPTARRALDASASTWHNNIVLDATRVQASAWADVADGKFDDARSTLSDAARLARERGFSTTEGAHLHHHLRVVVAAGEHGASVDEDSGHRLIEMASSIPGGLSAARLAHAEAALERSPEGWLGAAEGFHDLGLDLVAAECAQQAARGAQRCQEAALAARAEELARACTSRCPDAATPGVRLSRAAAPLTSRQSQIALLAADGATDKEIAARLGLSVRTVSNQLLRAYQALGIGGRNELSQHLGTTGGSV